MRALTKQIAFTRSEFLIFSIILSYEYSSQNHDLSRYQVEGVVLAPRISHTTAGYLVQYIHRKLHMYVVMRFEKPEEKTGLLITRASIRVEPPDCLKVSYVC